MSQAIEVEPIVVAGRTFRPTMKTTFEQDFFVVELMSQTSVTKLSAARGDELDKVAEEVILNAYRSGNLFRLLAGMTVEEGKKWTIKSAEENAIFFAELSEPEDKDAIREALIGILLSFFVDAEKFSAISRTSSSVTLETKVEPNPSLPVDHSGAVLGQTSSEVLAALTLTSTTE